MRKKTGVSTLTTLTWHSTRNYNTIEKRNKKHIGKEEIKVCQITGAMVVSAKFESTKEFLGLMSSVELISEGQALHDCFHIICIEIDRRMAGWCLPEHGREEGIGSC